jgi:hypothetical protein
MAYSLGYSILNLIAEPDLHLGIGDTFRLAPDDRDIYLVFQSLEWLREIPRVGVPVASGR